MRLRNIAAGLTMAVVAACGMIAPAMAQAGPTPGDEGAIQAYLAMWSHNRDVNAASVARFYAPSVIYYGKRFSRAQVLADKKAYIESWPVRDYREIPGSIEARCNRDRSRCRVSVIMGWRRVSRTHRVSVGRARIAFDFVPTEGGRKIARESARNL